MPFWGDEAGIDHNKPVPKHGKLARPSIGGVVHGWLRVLLKKKLGGDVGLSFATGSALWAPGKTRMFRGMVSFWNGAPRGPRDEDRAPLAHGVPVEEEGGHGKKRRAADDVISTLCHQPPSGPMHQPTQNTLVDSVSQLRDLVRTPGSPNESDLTKFREELVSKMEALGKCEAAIVHEREILRKLEEERKSLLWCIGACKAMVAPVRRLPDEVLREIFALVPPVGQLYLIWESPTKENDWHAVAKTHLLRLARVCSRWRRVVQSSPSLWADIKLDMDVWPYDNRRARYIDALRRTLQLSGECSLDVDLAGTPTRDVADMLADSCIRWRHLRLSLSEAERAESVSLFAGRMSSLRTASIKFRSSGIALAWTIPRQPVYADLFGPNTELQHLYLSLPVGLHISPFPWANLRSLHIKPSSDYAIDDVLDVLNEIPEMERDLVLNLDIGHYEIKRPFGKPPRDPILSQTNILHLQSISSESLASLMSCLTLLRLRELRVWSQRSNIKISPERFSGLCARSSLHNTLTSLDVVFIQIGSADLLCCLRELAALESLACADHPMHSGWRSGLIRKKERRAATTQVLDNNLLRGLGAFEHGQGKVIEVAPRLKRFTFVANLRFNPRLLRDLVHQRRSATVASEGLEFELGIGLPSQRSGSAKRERQYEVIQEQMQPLVEQGVLRMLQYRPKL
ncbi:Ubiquitin-conjugating enzyme e2 [Mycena chlorophos]|uniref:Ubiquitin-conjugating enzyme e2 n=1 Tax=Mycena chlorophos TaxID=658473 RepID=A0A8H6SRW2_MYCCL|nr:Ubiquitin-conjugating enzyme e2 [Mycena chlorophos]